MSNKSLKIVVSSLAAIIVIMMLYHFALAEGYAYEHVMNNNDIEACEHFIEKYPQSDHIPQVNHHLKNLKAIQEEQYYQQLVSSGSLQELIDYAQRNPQSPHMEALESMIESRTFYEVISSSNDIATVLGFLKKYPASDYTSLAQSRLDVLEKEYFEKYINVPTANIDKSRLAYYTSTFPHGKYLSQAKAKHAAITDDDDYAEALKVDSRSALKNYLDSHPNGRHSSEAKARIQEKDDYEYYKNYSLPNGSQPYASFYGRNGSCDSWGCSNIVIKAPAISDVVTIIKNGSGKVVRHAYIRKGSSYTFEVPNGYYNSSLKI